MLLTFSVILAPSTVYGFTGEIIDEGVEVVQLPPVPPGIDHFAFIFNPDGSVDLITDPQLIYQIEQGSASSRWIFGPSVVVRVHWVNATQYEIRVVNESFNVATGVRIFTYAPCANGIRRVNTNRELGSIGILGRITERFTGAGGVPMVYASVSISFHMNGIFYTGGGLSFSPFH